MHHPLVYSKAAKYNRRKKTLEDCNQIAGKFQDKARSQLHKFYNQEEETVELPDSVMKKEILVLSPPDL